MKKVIYGWCFQNEETGKLDPYEMGWDGYGIFPTKKELMDNVWNEKQEGYSPIRVEVKLIVKK